MLWHFSKHFVSWCFLNIYEPQLTLICIGFLENMDKSRYRYFFDRIYFNNVRSNS